MIFMRKRDEHILERFALISNLGIGVAIEDFKFIVEFERESIEGRRERRLNLLGKDENATRK